MTLKRVCGVIVSICCFQQVASFHPSTPQEIGAADRPITAQRLEESVGGINAPTGSWNNPEFRQFGEAFPQMYTQQGHPYDGGMPIQTTLQGEKPAEFPGEYRHWEIYDCMLIHDAEQCITGVGNRMNLVPVFSCIWCYDSGMCVNGSGEKGPSLDSLAWLKKIDMECPHWERVG